MFFTNSATDMCRNLEYEQLYTFTWKYVLLNRDMLSYVVWLEFCTVLALAHVEATGLLKLQHAYHERAGWGYVAKGLVILILFISHINPFEEITDLSLQCIKLSPS